MLLWFAVVMVLFAVGDVVAKLTKARISSVFATLMLFLVLFVAGVLPADIIEKAEEEGIALITTDLSAYHVAGRMHEKGIA